MFKTNRRNQTPRNLVAKLMGWNADANALEQRIVPAYVAGDFGWASTFETGNVNIENVVRSTVVDNSGNVYQVGSFTGTVDFDPGAGTTNLTAVGGQDAFVEKLDSTGKLLWVKTFSGASDEKANSITLDASGNPIITGWYQGTVDFDPSSTVYNSTSRGAEDAFVLKLNISGTLLWAKNIGGASSDQGYTITTDTTGNILTGGLFYGTADFDPGVNVDNLTTNSGHQDIFVLKLDSSGNYIWSKSILGMNDCQKWVYDIQTDNIDNIVIGGIFWGTGILDLDPGTSVFKINGAGGPNDGYVVKLSATGDFMWGQGIGSNINDGVSRVAIDSANNVYLCSGFEGTVDFDASSAQQNLTANLTDAYLLKLSSSGAYQWVKSWGGSSYDFAKSIAIDANNLIKISSNFKGTVDFDPSSNSSLQVGSTNNYNTAVSEFDTAGNFIAVQSIQTNDHTAMVLTSTGRPVLVAGYSGTMDFDPDSQVKNLTSIGGTNFFITQWNRQFTKTTVSVSDSFTGANTTLTATIQNEDKTGSTGTVTFTDVFNGVTTTLGTATVTNGVATLLLPTVAVGVHNFSASYSGDATNFSSNSYPLVSLVDAVAGSFGWAEAFVNRSSTGNNTSGSTFTDKLGNIYLAGNFTGTTDFNAGTGTQTYTSVGSSDFFLAKLTPDGNLIWFKQWANSTIQPWIRQAYVNTQDQIAICGTFTNTMDFDPGLAIVTKSSNGIGDGFAMILDLNGNYLNSLTLGGTGDDSISGIAFDSQNNIILAGHFTYTVDFDLTSVVSNYTSKGGNDAFLVKYDSLMKLIFVNQIGNSANSTTGQIFMALDLDQQNNIYVIGFSGWGSWTSDWQNLDLDPSPTNNVQPSNWSFLVKYSPAGTYVNYAALDMYTRAIKIVNSEIYIVGSWNYTTKAEKFNLNLNRVWAYYLPSGSDGQATDLENLVVDWAKNVYFVGGFTGTVNFNPAGTNRLTSKGSHDIFILTVDQDGKYKSTTTMGSNGYDAASSAFISASNSLAISGGFSGTVDFDPSSAVANLQSNPGLISQTSGFLMNITNLIPAITTSTTLSSSPTSSIFGQAVTFTATLTALDGLSPSGLNVTFYDGTTVIGSGTLANGIATLNIANLVVGAHSLTAKISDATNKYLTSTSTAVAFTVSKSDTQLALTSSTNPAVYGQSVTFTSTVSAKSPGAGSPSGTVTFKDGTTVLGTSTLNASGVATFATSALAVATHSITSVYNGDTNFTTTTSSAVNQVVNQAATTSVLTSSATSFIFGQSVTFTGTVTANSPGVGTPSGTVSFKEGTTVLGTGTLNASGVATFSTTTLSVGSHNISAVYESDLNFSTSTSGAVSLTIAPNTTKIQTFSQDASTVTLAFNKAIATTLLQINDSYTGSTLTEQADLTVTDASNQPVKGSMMVAPDAKSVTFIKTGTNFADGTYKVKLRSAANGFRNSSGELIDGDNDGVAGGDYSATFTVANNARVLSIPDVVRGPGQALRVNTTDLGIPVKINDGVDIYAFEISLNYDPILMTVTDVVVPSSLSNDLQITFNTATAGRIDVIGIAVNGLPSGAQSLFYVNGTVPNNAAYRSKSELMLSNISFFKLDDSKISTTVDHGIQLVSYIGDVTGDGRYNALDPLRIQRYLVNLDRWYAQFPLVDPVMVADITGDGRVNALDSLYLQRYLVNMPVTFLSAPPVTSVTQTTGLDPVIRLPKNLTAYRGQNIQVPVELQNTDPQAIQVNSFEVAIAIDPKTFKMLRIQSDATIRTRYDARKGILVIGGILSDVTLKPGESLIIAKLNLKVAGHAVATDYALNLLDQARIGKEQYATSVNGEL